MLCSQWPTRHLWESHHRCSVIEIVCWSSGKWEMHIIQKSLNWWRIPGESDPPARWGLARHYQWIRRIQVIHRHSTSPPRYPRSLSSPSSSPFSSSSTPLSPNLHHSMDGEECEDGDITEPIASCTSLPPASPRENGRHEVSIQMMMMFHQNWHHRQMHYLHACTRAKILPTVAI